MRTCDYYADLKKRNEAERELVRKIMHDFRTSIRCGCTLRNDDNRWAVFQFQYLGTHIPECPNAPKGV